MRRLVASTAPFFSIKLSVECSRWVAECESAELAAEGNTAYEALEALGVLFAAKGIGTTPMVSVH